MPTGRKNERHYRLVVTPARSKLTGKPVAVIGHYHPQTNQLTVNHKLLTHWLSSRCPTLAQNSRFMSDFLKFLITPPSLSQPEKLSISEAGSTLYLQVDEQTTAASSANTAPLSLPCTMIRTYCTLRNLPYTTLILKTE